MPTRVLRLNYPPSLLSQPILNKLIQRYEITVNIRQAHITLEEGLPDNKCLPAALHGV